jgi:hypothetical protein
VTVKLVVTPDEFEPYGTLTAADSLGEVISTVKVPPDFRLTRDGAARWAADGFNKIR